MSQAVIGSSGGGGGGTVTTLTGNSGGPVSPLAGNINTVGTGSLTVVDTPNTTTVQLTGLTNHSLLVGAGTPTITNLGVATNGQLPIGSVGADPVLATLTAGTGITIVNGAGSITISSTNGSSGTGTTVGAVTADLITISPANLKSFSVQALISGYDAANDIMFGGELLGNGRKNGTVTVVGTPDSTLDSDPALASASYTLVGSAGNFIVRVTGVAGHTIAWNATLTYISSP